MGVAGRYRIADPEEMKGPARVGGMRLWASGQQIRVIHAAEIARQGLELEIEIVGRNRPMIDPHLVDAPLLEDATVIAADRRHEPVAVAPDLCQTERHREGDVALLER